MRQLITRITTVTANAVGPFIPHILSLRVIVNIVKEMWPFITIMLSLTFPVLIFWALMPKIPVRESVPIIAPPIPEWMTPGVKKVKEEQLAQVEDKPIPFEKVRKTRRRHVLDKYVNRLKGRVDTALASILSQEGTMVHVAGVVIGLRELNSKAGMMATLVLDDPSGRAECVIYPMTYLAHPVKENEIVLLNGKVSNSKILVNGLEILGKKRFRKKKEGQTP